jgi:phenylacetate-CoA ligase
MNLSYSNEKLREIYDASPEFVKEIMTFGYSMKARRDRYGGAFSEQLAELKRDESLSQEEIAADQLRRLKEIVTYAGENVPYYQRLFKSIGFKPESLQSLEDIRQIPILEKETIREHKDELITRADVGGIKKTRTGGTTGKALSLVISREGYQRHNACIWYQFGLSGIRRGERMATFGSHPVAPRERTRPPFWVLDRLENELFFSTLHVNPGNLESYARALSAFKPAMVRGFPSSIYLLAQHVLETGREDIRPRVVYTSSEPLLGFQKKIIEKAFACKAYNYYAFTEAAAHIYECPSGGRHVITEGCLLEVLKPDGTPAKPGELGEFICTGFFDRAMPLIRYRIGDAGIVGKGPCSCGRNSPILCDLFGRVADSLITPEGNQIVTADIAFQDTLSVKEAQVVQEEVHSIRVKIVPRADFDHAADEKKIRDGLRSIIGPNMRIDFEFVDHIPVAENGKFKFMVSKIPGQSCDQPQRNGC